VLESEVELLYDSHLLVVELDMVIRNHPQNSFCGKQTKVTILTVLVEDFEHPKDDGGIKDFFLVLGLVLHVEVDYI
jgi:hypothetical protein